MALPKEAPTAPPAAADDRNDPVTLHRVMQTMIGEGLRAHFRPQKKLSHELFVLLIQLKEEEHKAERKAAQAKSAKPRASRAKAAAR